MEDLVCFLTQVAIDPQYPKWLYWCTAILICGLTQLIKLPIKHFTDKITVETTRKKVNTVIMFIPIILGILASYLLTFAHYSFSEEAGIRLGTASIVIYGIISRVLARINSGNEISIETIKEDATEAIIDAQETEQEFRENVESQKQLVSATQTAEQEFAKLIEQIKKQQDSE